MRRELRFKNFDDARAELARLEQGPVETTGHWSYFQILTHLTKAVEGSMKGLKREMSWWRRYVKGPLAARATITAGFIPAGIQGAATGASVERIEGDEKEALGQLRRALETFEKFEGKLGDHPRFGALNQKTWYLFHTFHMANHLGHAKPKE